MGSACPRAPDPGDCGRQHPGVLQFCPMTNFTPHCRTCRCNTVTLATVEKAEQASALVDRWLDAEVEFRAPESGQIYRRHLARAFETWCQAQGIEPASPNALYARLRLLGHREVKRRGLFYFRGISIKGTSATLVPPTAEAAADET